MSIGVLFFYPIDKLGGNFMEYVWLILGFVLLIKGADWFVDGASALSKKFGIPSVVIGLTVVAFGTSLPEASVSISAALSQSSGISVGNVVGSNIFNLLIVAGASAVFCPIRVDKSIIKKDMPFSFLITLALLFLTFSIFPNSAPDNVLTRADGIILLLFFTLFMFYTFRAALNAPAPEENKNEKIMPLWQQLLFILVGLAGIVIGGDRTVEGAKVIASNFGMSDSLIGLTIVAIGTSLPELVTSIVAARKGESDIAIGNVIGSNIFNILFVLGVSSVITPIVINASDIVNSMYDIIIVALVTLLVYIPIVKTKKISRPVGAVMVIAYVIYTAYIIMR